jgi:hypothetical protein
MLLPVTLSLRAAEKVLARRFRSTITRASFCFGVGWLLGRRLVHEILVLAYLTDIAIKGAERQYTFAMTVAIKTYKKATTV